MSKVYPKGLRFFPAREGAPSFVKGTLIVTPRELTEWLKSEPQHLTDYNDQKQLKLQLLEGDKGLYATVDTYKPKQEKAQKSNDPDGLPF